MEDQQRSQSEKIHPWLEKEATIPGTEEANPGLLDALKKREAAIDAVAGSGGIIHASPEQIESLDDAIIEVNGLKESLGINSQERS